MTLGHCHEKYRKAVRWCASLIRSLYWLIRLIWIGFLDLWVDWTDLVNLIGLLNEWIQYIIYVDVCPISCISWVQISWYITPESKYVMVADFMRYYTKIKISHGCVFHEILHQNHNISWLQISWDITPEQQYLIDADLVRYYTRTTVSHGFRFCEILYQDNNISLLQILWDI